MSVSTHSSRSSSTRRMTQTSWRTRSRGSPSTSLCAQVARNAPQFYMTPIPRMCVDTRPPCTLDMNFYLPSKCQSTSFVKRIGINVKDTTVSCPRRLGGLRQIGWRSPTDSPDVASSASSRTTAPLPASCSEPYHETRPSLRHSPRVGDHRPKYHPPPPRPRRLALDVASIHPVLQSVSLARGSLSASPRTSRPLAQTCAIFMVEMNFVSPSWR